MPDLVDQLRSEIDARIKELRPLVDEHERLAAAAAALSDTTGTKPADGATRSRRRAAAPKRRNGAPKRGRRKGTGERAQQALAAVQARPGITIPEIAEQLGIKQNYLYRVMSNLADAGQVKKRGKGWHASAAPGPGATPPTPTSDAN